MTRTRGSGCLFQPKYKDRHGLIRTQKLWWWKIGNLRGPTKKKTVKEAERVLRDKLIAHDQGRLVVEGATLADLIAMVVADYKANGRRSLDRVERAGVHLTEFFGEEARTRTITTDRVTAYVAARLEGGAKPATINREQALLRRGFHLARRAGKADARPEFSMLAERNVRKGFFEREQLDAVLAQLPAPLRPVIEVAAITGWRVISELLTRQWRHVDMDAGWLRLEPGETKNGEGRQFPFTDALRAILKAQKKRAEETERRLGRIVPWLFFWEDGRGIRAFRASWVTATKNAGVPGRLVHDFRRTAVRNMERAGVPRSSAMAMVGHKTEAMYRRYAIVDETSLREAGRRLSAARTAPRRARLPKRRGA